MAEKKSGGAHTSRTMLLMELSSVLAQCDPNSSLDQYREAVIDSNVAGKRSLSSRQRTFRYLRELYALDLNVPEFRAFVRLWRRERSGRPVMALLFAAWRDPLLLATAGAVLAWPEGRPVHWGDLDDAVEVRYPGSYSPNIRAKIGRNTLSSWTQAGYLVRVDRGPAIRSKFEPSPGAVAMALVVGAAGGASGARLFTGEFANLLNAPLQTLHDRAYDASRKGWLEYRSLGNVTEVDLSKLLAEASDTRLPLEGGDPK
jgi:hypothetical protein